MISGVFSIYASVEIADYWERRDFVESLKKYGVTGKEFGQHKVEIRYTGSHDTVMKLEALCDSIQAHSINVFQGTF